jgi:hypothetical protein
MMPSTEAAAAVPLKSGLEAVPGAYMASAEYISLVTAACKAHGYVGIIAIVLLKAAVWGQLLKTVKCLNQSGPVTLRRAVLHEVLEHRRGVTHLYYVGAALLGGQELCRVVRSCEADGGEVRKLDADFAKCRGSRGLRTGARDHFSADQPST